MLFVITRSATRNSESAKAALHQVCALFVADVQVMLTGSVLRCRAIQIKVLGVVAPVATLSLPTHVGLQPIGEGSIRASKSVSMMCDIEVAIFLVNRRPF